MGTCDYAVFVRTVNFLISSAQLRTNLDLLLLHMWTLDNHRTKDLANPGYQHPNLLSFPGFFWLLFIALLPNPMSSGLISTMLESYEDFASFARLLPQGCPRPLATGSALYHRIARIPFLSGSVRTLDSFGL